jgi:signal transduction histidine kinase
VIDEGRNALRGLRSAEDRQCLDQGFSRIPQELAVQQTVGFGVVVEGQQRLLHPVIHDEVYRICREALANAFRHSQATNVVIAIEYAQSLRIVVREDGCGMDPQILRSARDGHFGLQGMHARARRIGSKLTVSSRPVAGTEVILLVPGNVPYHTHSHRDSPREFANP